MAWNYPDGFDPSVLEGSPKDRAFERFCERQLPAIVEAIIRNEPDERVRAFLEEHSDELEEFIEDDEFDAWWNSLDD